MEFALLGKLKVDPEDDERQISKKIPVPLLNGTPVRFVIESIGEDRRPKDFEDAVGNFLRLGKAERDHASTYLLQVCKAATVSASKSSKVASQQSIWDHVRPQEIRVRRRDRRDKKIYVAVDAECTWDEEHGLQIVFREGRELSRVSEQDDELTYTDAFDLAESKDRIC